MKSSYKGEVKTVEEVLKSEQFKYANDLLAYRVKHQLTQHETAQLLQMLDKKYGQMESAYQKIPVEDYKKTLNRFKELIV